MTSTSAQALSSSLNKLQITKNTLNDTKKSTSQPIDSWEDEDAESTPIDERVQRLSPPAGDFPGAPPTSPASPSVRTKATSSGSPWQTFPPYGLNGSFEAESENHSPPQSTKADPERRPEKTTSVASRLIAAGIGAKLPKRTQEQREYDQAIKMQEKKKRDAAKEAELKIKRDTEKAKAAIWED